MPTAKQRKRAQNILYYQAHKEKLTLQRCEKYATDSDKEKAASQADSKASVNIATVKQKKRALNRMYYHVHKQKMCLQKRESMTINYCNY